MEVRASDRPVARRRWALAAAVSTVVVVVALGAAALARDRPDRSTTPATPASPATSPTATASFGPRPPISVQPDLAEPGESQFDPGPQYVPPTERPATDIGGTPTPSPSASAS